MNDYVRALLDGDVGLCITDEDDIDSISDDDLMRLSELFVHLMGIRELLLYDYDGDITCVGDVCAYLHRQLAGRWNYLCRTTIDYNDIPMLVGCKIGFFRNGAGQGRDIVTIDDLFSTSNNVCIEQPEFDEILAF